MKKHSYLFRLTVFTFVASILIFAAKVSALPISEDSPAVDAGMAGADYFVETEDQLVNESLSQAGVFFSRPRLVKLLSNSKKVVLTFDDGPHPKTTPKVLEILRKRNIKAIFFVLGLQAEKYPELLKQIHAEGHEIGNHSYNHKNLAQLSEEQLKLQIEKTNSIIEKITGQKPEFLRPPYGAMNKQVIRAAMNEKMNILLWTIDPKDWQSKNEASIMRNLDKQLGLNGNLRGGAVLLHDIYPATVRALDPFLDKLATNDYQIASIHSLDSNSMNYWASTSPELLKNSFFRRHFDPEISGHSLLVNLIGVPHKQEVSSMALLRASKSGDLLIYLAKNSR